MCVRSCKQTQLGGKSRVRSGNQRCSDPTHKTDRWPAPAGSGLLSLGGTKGSSLCCGCKVMSRKAMNIIPGKGDCATEGRPSQWEDTNAGCAPGQYLVSGKPLSIPMSHHGAQEQVENGALGKGKAEVLEGGAWR